MSENRVQFNAIVSNQLPLYVKEDFPLISEFLEQYYLGQEYQGGPVDLIQNIDKYIKLIMSQSKLEKDKAKEIVKVILNSNSSPPIFDYLTNREETGVTIDELLQARNIFAVDKWSNFDPQFLAWLAKYKWVEKGVGMGSGEILVSVLIKGGRKAGASGEKGDTIVNDVELEVKSDNGIFKEFSILSSRPSIKEIKKVFRISNTCES